MDDEFSRWYFMSFLYFSFIFLINCFVFINYYYFRYVQNINTIYEPKKNKKQKSYRKKRREIIVTGKIGQVELKYSSIISKYFWNNKFSNLFYKYAWYYLTFFPLTIILLFFNYGLNLYLLSVYLFIYFYVRCIWMTRLLLYNDIIFQVYYCTMISYHNTIFLS